MWQERDRLVARLFKSGAQDPCDMAAYKIIDLAATSCTDLYKHRITFHNERAGIYGKRNQQFQKSGASIESAKLGITTAMNNVESELRDFKSRRVQLIGSLGFVDKRSKIPEPVAHMDSLIQACERRLANLKGTLSWGADSSRVIEDLCKDALKQSELHREFARLYAAEGELWTAVYESLGMRLAMGCQTKDIKGGPPVSSDLPNYSHYSRKN
jgi:hypothetical protein